MVLHVLTNWCYARSKKVT